MQAGSANLYAEASAELDRILLPAVLRHTGGNQYQAAKILGMARQTLRTRLRELGISVSKVVDEDDVDAG